MLYKSGFIQRHRNWCLFFVMTGASLIVCFQQVALAAVSGDVAAALQVDVVSLGLLTSAFFLSYALMQIPAGILSDTVGARKSVTVALLAAALGTLLFALADNLVWAVLARTLMGLSLAVIVVPSMKLTAVWFPVSAFARLTAISFAISALGPLLATSPMAYAAVTFGWRWPFAALAAVSAVSALVIWVIVRDSPEKIREFVNMPGSGQGIANITMRAARHPNGRRLLRKLGVIVRTPAIRTLSLWSFCQGGIYFAFIGLWGGQYLSVGLKLPMTETGLILSLAACALITSPLFSWLAEKLGSARKLLILMSAASVLFWIPLCLGLPQMSGLALSFYFLGVSISSYGGAAVLFAAAKEHCRIELSGTVSGFVNMFSFVGGAVLQQLVGFGVEFLQSRGLGVHEAMSRSFCILLLAACASLYLAWKYREVRVGRHRRSARLQPVKAAI